MKKIIYTTIFGDGYTLREPDKVCDGWRYICYTDRNYFKSDVWEVVNVPVKDTLSSRAHSRKYKILCSWYEGKNDDIFLYIDAKFRPIKYLDEFVCKYLSDTDIAMLQHNKRTCVYSEAKFIAVNNIDKWENMSKQITRYVDSGMQKSYGLLAPGIMLIRHNDLTSNFLFHWWDEYFKGCERDMLSLMFTVWEYRKILRIRTMPFRETYKRFRK